MMISLELHTIVQLLVFLRFHEWHQTRPGYFVCPECKNNFQATPIEGRHHRGHCRIPALIKELQAVVMEATTEEGGNAMPFPNTREALKENGYVFSHTKTCEACNVTIEMWITPKEHLMPLDFKPTENGEVCEPHFATCKKPELYSRRLREKKAKEVDVGPIVPT